MFLPSVHASQPRLRSKNGQPDHGTPCVTRWIPLMDRFFLCFQLPSLCGLPPLLFAPSLQLVGSGKHTHPLLLKTPPHSMDFEEFKELMRNTLYAPTLSRSGSCPLPAS